MEATWNIQWEDKWISDTTAFHRGREKKILFLKYLVTQRNLFSGKDKAGGQLCTAIASKAIGCSQPSVCSYLKQLAELGWVTLVNPKWKVGEMSRRWQVISPELREIHLAVMGDKFSKRLQFVAKSAIKELRVRRNRCELFKNLSRIRLTSADADSVSSSTAELRAEIKKIVWAYKGKEQSLLVDFTDHMFKMRHKYHETRKRYMAWFFYQMVVAYHSRGKKTELRLADFTAGACICFRAIRSKKVELYTARAQAIYDKVKGVLTPMKASKTWLSQGLKGKVKRGPVEFIKGLVHLKYLKQSPASYRERSTSLQEASHARWTDLFHSYDHFRLDQSLSMLS